MKWAMYIVNLFDSSVAFKLLDLKQVVTARVSIGQEEIAADKK